MHHAVRYTGELKWVESVGNIKIQQEMKMLHRLPELVGISTKLEVFECQQVHE